MVNAQLQARLHDERKRFEALAEKMRSMEASRSKHADKAESRGRERDHWKWLYEQSFGRGIVRFRNVVRKVLARIYEKKWLAHKNDQQFHRELNALARKLRSDQLARLQADYDRELAQQKRLTEALLARLRRDLANKDAYSDELKKRLDDVSRARDDLDRQRHDYEDELKDQREYAKFTRTSAALSLHLTTVPPSILPVAKWSGFVRS
jgi:hypothetical protein